MAATIKKVWIKRNDEQPYIRGYAKNSDDGTPIDLTGAVIRCNMIDPSTGTLKINRQTAGITILDQGTDKGKFYYAPQVGDGDTDTSAEYNIEFEITPSSGGKFTLPGHGRIWEVEVWDDLDET